MRSQSLDARSWKSIEKHSRSLDFVNLDNVVLSTYLNQMLDHTAGLVYGT